MECSARRRWSIAVLGCFTVLGFVGFLGSSDSSLPSLSVWLWWVGACFSESQRRCALMSLWLPTEIEMHHFALRSREEFAERRGWAIQADGQDVEVEFRLREDISSVCAAPQRIRRFVPSLKAQRALPWSERKVLYEKPPGFSRKHFLTALAEVNLVTPEDDYLLEWIDFHLLVGFDHFVIYDAKNLTSTRHALETYISEGYVELVPCRVDPTGNCLLVEQLSRSGNQEFDWRRYAVLKIAKERSTHWIALMDIDEFFFPRRLASLRDILVPESHPAGISGFFIWQLNFGSSGWQTRPAQLQIEAYSRSASQRDWNGKSIAQADALVLNGTFAYKGNPHLLLSGSEPGVKRCDAHMQDFQGNVHCIENPVRMFDVVGIALCLANFLVFAALGAAPCMLRSLADTGRLLKTS
ncbi:unnamed protein product [Symbiodinium microadriaticum]|nr:unnamed protein product [Symbiodinium microadriaticum]